MIKKIQNFLRPVLIVVSLLIVFIVGFFGFCEADDQNIESEKYSTKNDSINKRHSQRNGMQNPNSKVGNDRSRNYIDNRYLFDN